MGAVTSSKVLGVCCGVKKPQDEGNKFFSVCVHTHTEKNSSPDIGNLHVCHGYGIKKSMLGLSKSKLFVNFMG